MLLQYSALPYIRRGAGGLPTMDAMHGPLRIDGTALARSIEQRVAASVVPSTLELVGFVASGDAAGRSFQETKRRAAARCGIAYRTVLLPEGIRQEAAESAVRAAAHAPSCQGIVVQLPLPASLDTAAMLALIPPHKDPDVLGITGGALPAPAAGAVSEILRLTNHVPQVAAVIGQGRLVGIPVSRWLQDQGVSVRRLDKGFDERELSGADLVVLGTGAYRLDPGLLSEGAGVIDFGYQDGRGDLDASDPARLVHLSFFTPTPGGTGPVLVAKLMENFQQLIIRDVGGTGLEPVTSSV